jgi:hypothetical protein
MSKVLTGFADHAFGSAATRGWPYLGFLLGRPSAGLEKAPKNIVDHLKPSRSRDFVQRFLGRPRRVVGQRWIYRFLDVLVQVEFCDDGGAKSVGIGLVDHWRNRRVPVSICDRPLGQFSIADAQAGPSRLRYRTLPGRQEVLVETRVGPSGAWTHGTFGATMAEGKHSLSRSRFEWNHDMQRLKTPPSSVRVNWVAVSIDAVEVCFDWSAD